MTIILPVYNGEQWIAAKLESILRLDYPADLLEILVLSDGSTDRTHGIVSCFTNRANVRLIVLPRAGKAAALNVGMEEASGEILFFTDVRQELAATSLTNLVECFADPEVGAASGELIIRDGSRDRRGQRRALLEIRKVDPQAAVAGRFGAGNNRLHLRDAS